MQASSIAGVAQATPKKNLLRLLLLPLVILAGMGLSVEAGLLGPLGVQVGHLWATLSIFGVGTAILVLLLLFYAVPAIIFWPTRKRLNRVPEEMRPKALALRTTATLLPLAYFGFGWTQVFFAHNSGNMFYIFGLAVLWGGICGLQHPGRSVTDQ